MEAKPKNKSMKNILFISALDFKEKSIQVIRKTPEAYVKAGWDVHYVVARDNVKHGNYFYEKTIDLEGVNTHRFVWPIQCLREKFTSRFFSLLLNKIVGFLVVLKLAWVGYKILRETDIDVVYGYELHGVLAVSLLRLFGQTKNTKIVSRFQGTFLNEMIKAKQYLRIVFNFDLCLALWLACDLCIMTNDGTQGDKAIKKISPEKYKDLKFWVNGVDTHVPNPKNVEEIQNKYQLMNRPVFISISRLTHWKRVDRALKTFYKLKSQEDLNSFSYLVVGEGEKKDSLQKLSHSLGLDDNVVFVGSVNNSEVKNYLEVADYFVSTYESSNVGNPLLEAIRANKIIFTLNNGDTSEWITKGENGYIYNEDESLYQSMAEDMRAIVQDSELQQKITEGVKQLESEKLWTWEERFNAEMDAVEGMLCS